ncbi:Hypothetical protein LOCK900_0972 [Lacticaseibacillus rhamnosus LOCK900]|nr:Hypothetical protein LOCK900_0972 [Lacticaseibacillus rhamnosus LOCK900]
MFLVSPEMLLNQRFGAFYFGLFGVVLKKLVRNLPDFSS